MKNVIWLLALSAWPALPAFADAPPTQPKEVDVTTVIESFGWHFDTPVTTKKLGKELWVLMGVGGNVIVSVGSQGVLIVDDQFPQMAPKLKTAMKKLGAKQVDFAINTHWHFDHTQGNLVFGPEGTWLVSQANSRAMMAKDVVHDFGETMYVQKAYPEASLPIITFDDTMRFHFNGQVVELIHAGPAHTTGDAAVIFRGSNVVHTGDVFNTAGYPFIDIAHGGTLDGMIAFGEAIRSAINKKTVVVPGHGSIASYQDLVDYIAMLKKVRARMARLIKKGKSLEQIQAAGITKEWDKKNGDPAIFLTLCYHSLNR